MVQFRVDRSNAYFACKGNEKVTQNQNGYSRIEFQDGEYNYAHIFEKVLKKYDNPNCLSLCGDVIQTFSTHKVLQTIETLSYGLKFLGLKKGHSVGILAPSSPYWTMMDFAIILSGGITVPFFSNISIDNFQFQAQNSECKFLFVAGVEEWNNYKDHLTDYDVIIRLEDFKQEELEDKEGPKLVDYKSLLDLGRKLQKQDPESFKQGLKELKEDDLATIIYTSGSTGVPKGVELTHKNLVTQALGCLERLPIEMGVKRALSVLPTAHVFERTVVNFYIFGNVSLYFADDIKKVGALMREIKPNLVTMVPRLLEKVYEAMLSKVLSAPFHKKALGRFAFGLAFKEESALRSFLKPVLNPIIYSKLREAFGGELIGLVLGGAPLSPSLGRFFQNIDMAIYQGYGLTESSPIIAVNYPGYNKMGSVGPAFPGVEIKITEDMKEICVKGPNVMRGYHKMPEATEAVLKDGWLHTGDRGVLDSQGFLTITGRIKEFLKTSNGKYISPIPIEQALGKSRLVEMSMVVAEGRKFASCLLFLSQEELEKRMKKQRTKSLDDLVRGSELQGELQQLVDKVNRTLNRWEQIKKFELITNPVSVETGELTPTMKIKRFAVAEKYREVIEAMYQELGEQL